MAMDLDDEIHRYSATRKGASFSEVLEYPYVPYSKLEGCLYPANFPSAFLDYQIFGIG